MACLGVNRLQASSLRRVFFLPSIRDQGSRLSVPAMGPLGPKDRPRGGPRMGISLTMPKWQSLATKVRWKIGRFRQRARSGAIPFFGERNRPDASGLKSILTVGGGPDVHGVEIGEALFDRHSDDPGGRMVTI